MVGALQLLAGLALVAVPALLLPAALGVRGPLARGLAGLIVAAATIVLATEGLSLLSAWQPGWMLLAELIAAAASYLVWRRAGRPALRIELPRAGRIRAAAADHPVAAAAVAVAVAALALQAVMAIAVAPNNFDSMTYHLARIAYWLQADSVLHFAGGNTRQLAFPPNGEFLQGWTILLFEADRFASLVQWGAAAGLGGAIALGARFLAFSRPAAAFAGALFVLLPQPLLQATTTQNDLIVTFLVAASIVFMVRGIRDRRLGETSIGLVAIALAVGTKGTALIAGFSVLLLVIAALYAYRPPLRLIARGAAVGVAAFALFGAFNYALNIDTYGDPIGPATTGTDRQPGTSVAASGVRVAWSFVDSPGLDIPWLSNAFERTGEALFDGVKYSRFESFAIDTNVHEDLSSYGLFGLFVLLPLLLVVLLRPSSRPARRIVAAAALLYIVVFVISSADNPWIGRVLMPAMAIGAPLLALLHRRTMLAAAAVALVAVGATPVLFANQRKLLVPDPSQANILALDRLQQQAIRYPQIVPAIRALDERLGRDSAIGLVRSGNTWDYPFFGPDYERRVVPLKVAEATEATMRREGLDALVFADIEPPASLDAEPIGDGYWLID